MMHKYRFVSVPRFARLSPRSSGLFLAVVALILQAAAGHSHASPARVQPEAAKARAALDFRQVIAEAKEKVFPAVVYIRCLREDLEGGKKQTKEVSGSGVIVTPDGEVVTNWHVIDKAVSVRCLLSDGQAFKATIVGSDKSTDLAMLRLDLASGIPAPPPSELPYAQIGDSTLLREGDFVMAMGAPWGLNRSVTIGIIACTRRYLEQTSEYSLWLQTDASINPGNSGGPLINTEGKIIGINTRASSMGGDMGFAVPTPTINVVLDQIRKQGEVAWSWTGLQLQPLRDFNKESYFDGTEGVIVAATDPDSPARAAGFQTRDRLLSVNGQSLNALTSEDLPAVQMTLGLLPKGLPARFNLLRGGEALSLEVQPRAKGKVEGEERDLPRWDMTVKAINQFDNPDLYFHRKEGVFVFGLKYPGNAGNANFRPKDIITQIEGKDVKTLDDIKAIHKEAIDNVATKNRYVFTVLRGGLNKQVVLDFSRDFSK
jgi:serine protease Do